MSRNNIPFKVAIGYGAVALVLILAIALVYSNTLSIIAINRASHEYASKHNTTDSLVANLLRQEQDNLQQLTDAMDNTNHENLLQKKAQLLDSGKDSIVIRPKTPTTHETKSTTVEVVKTRKGFFRRLADAFKSQHTDTITINRDSNKTTTDTTAMPINVGNHVADVLEQIDLESKHASKKKDATLNREVAYLKSLSAQMAQRATEQLEDIRSRESHSAEELNKAMEAREKLLWQMALLAVVAIAAAVILVYYVWRDSKKERIYRENLEQAKDETLRIMEQRERLLLTITHDIKAPTASISGFIDLLKDYVEKPEGLACLDNIRNSATHLSHLVAALLDYHQLERGQMELHPVSFNPITLVENCTEAMRPQAEQKGLSLSLHIDDESQQGLCRADAFRIRQVIDNLISNAIKYTAQGSIEVSVKMMGKWLIIAVKDTGQGMTPEERKRIFQAFARLKGAQGIEGVGLGLSITRELTHLLGGHIQLESAKGVGSTFTVTLPIERQREEKKEEPTKEVAPHNSLHPKPLRNHKLLILDDDPLQLQLLQEMLRRIAADKWIIHTCSHVSDALTWLHEEQPSVMMMDIEMPEMSGIDFIRHINHSHIIMAAMTAHDASIRPRLMEAGFDTCLFKPFKLEDLALLLGEPMPTDAPTTKEKKKENHFAPLLAFAENDAEAEREILSTTLQEVETHLAHLDTDTAKVAHKALPLATMLHLDCTEALKQLSPEHIDRLSEEEKNNLCEIVRKELKKIGQELRHYLQATSSAHL